MEEPAPYGGLLVQSNEAEKLQQQKLQEQAIEISVNGATEILRPEALFIKGVDSLSTQNIEAYVKYYLNYTTVTKEDGETTLESKPFEEQIKFRVQWVNDTSVTIVFTTHEDAIKALESISITASNPAIAPVPDKIDEQPEVQASLLIQERELKPYNPVIEFQKRLDLAHRLGMPQQEETGDMDEDESALVLYGRLAFQSDRKVKNASVYSRYYLLHGEPERKPRRGPRKPKVHKPRRHYDRDYDDDLFADKLRARDSRAQEEDLFSSKSRERSPERNRSRSPMRD